MKPPTDYRLPLPRAGQVVRALLIAEGMLVLASTAGQLIRYQTPYHSLLGLIDQFYVDNENNLPTYFSGMLLLCSGVLLGVVALLKHRSGSTFWPQWAVLAGLFGLLSVDEIASLHEMLIHPMKRYAPMGGPFFFGWVVPGGLFVAVVGLSMLRLVRIMPANLRRRVVGAGLMYLAGSLGVEMVGGAYYEQIEGQNLVYSLIVTLEETLEMTGVILLIRALLLYLSARLTGVSLNLRPALSAHSPHRQTQTSYAVAA
jgi:hypothetical protein